MCERFLPEYQTVYVISDLHLGGYVERYRDEMRDYRIFQDGAALAWFIRDVVLTDPSTGRIALVINGDLVDFLAVKDATYFDWKGADRKLTEIIEDPSLTEMWNALNAFVRKGRGDLVIVLGNHDLELALPGPQQLLLKRLAGSGAAQRARVIFAMDGAGFPCLVGDKHVFCTHGNEVDPWNAIEWGRLAFIRRALTRGSLVRDRKLLEDVWIPNPGTQLVIEHLNGVKRSHQWIDLLKPEEEGAAMVAAAITKSPAIRTFAEVMWNTRSIQKRLQQGFMGAGRVEQQEALPTLHWQPATPKEIDELLEVAVTAVARGQRPADLVDGSDEFLMGKFEMFRRTMQLKLWPTSLRDVLLATLTDNKAFDIATPDDVFRELDAVCGSSIDFLVAGHTHLQRARERDLARGKYYFNSGTWIRLAAIPAEALGPGEFEKVELRLLHGSIRRLADESPRLIREIRTVVKIGVGKDGRTRGRLFTVEPSANKGWAMVEVAGSQLPRA